VSRQLAIAQVVPIAYFIIGFSTEASRFFTFWFTNYLSALTGVAFGTLLTFMLPGHQVVMILFGLSQVRVLLLVASWRVL
jgi:ABC-type multidrug transport system permease subunit